MIAMSDDPLFFSRTPSDGSMGGGKTGERPDPETATEVVSEEVILCRQCMHPITSPRQCMEAEGSHRHTFANPHGVVFEIGCFRKADGCVYVGPHSGDFTWFRGFTWQVAVCGKCITHLGWRFSSGSGDVFHGLILNRLTGI